MGGLFGGGGHQPTLNTGAGSTYSSALQNIGGQLGNLYNQLGNQYQGNQANATSAANAYSQYLQSDPATQSYNAQQIAGAERGAQEGAVRAKAMLSSDLAQRGISPNSSMGVGGLSSIDAALAANNANIQNQNAIRNQERRGQNLATNAGLWGNLANTSLGQGQQVLGQQTGINQGLLSEADQMALQQYNAQMQAYEQNQQNQDALWGSLANAAATAFGKH